jgi:hypothetical protein
MKHALQLSAIVLCATLTSWLFHSMVSASSEPHRVLQLAASEGIAAGTTLAATRTATFFPGGGGGSEQSYGLAILYTTITDANDSETGVTLFCVGYRVNSATAYHVPACPWDSVNVRYNCDDAAVGGAGSGVGRGAAQFWNPADEDAADTKSRVFRIDVEGFHKVACSYAFTGGAAGDSIEVLVDVATKN